MGPYSGYIPAVMLGCGIGDALGMPYETLGNTAHDKLPSWTGEFEEGNWHKLPKGHYTDDTEMALCLAESLIACNGFNGADVARRYLEWISATPHGAGGSVKAALARVGDGCNWLHSGCSFADPYEVGSGTVMRVAPLGAFYSPKDITVMLHACRLDAWITHAHNEAVAASMTVAMFISSFMDNKYINDNDSINSVLMYVHANLYAQDLQRTHIYGFIESLLGSKQNHAQVSVDDFRFDERRGNAIQITKTALICAIGANSFEDGVLKAVRLGGDCDTRAAITGAILGARFGRANIPGKYVNGVTNADKLDSMDELLLRNRNNG